MKFKNKKQFFAALREADTFKDGMYDIGLRTMFIDAVESVSALKKYTFWRSLLVWLAISAVIAVVAEIISLNIGMTNTEAKQNALMAFTGIMLLSTLFSSNRSLRAEAFIRRRNIAKKLLMEKLPELKQQAQLVLQQIDDARVAICNCTDYKAYLTEHAPHPMLNYLNNEQISKYWAEHYIIAKLQSLAERKDDKKAYQSKLAEAETFLQQVMVE